MTNLDDLLSLASSQHGVFSRTQARELGIDRQVIVRRLRQGQWFSVTPAVLAVAGSPRTDLQQVMASVLDHGDACASHHSAAALWELPGFELLPAHVLTARPRRGCRSHPSVIHTSRVLPGHHVTVLESIPVTTPTRTMFDLSPHVHPARLERLVDTAWARRLTSGRHLHSMLRELQKRGRSRISAMRTVLAERGDDYRPPESNLEARVQQVLHDAGFGRFRRQVDSGDDETWLGRMDFRDPQYPLVLQIDSDRFHQALVDRAADEAQTAALEAAGYVVVRLQEFDVWHAAHRAVERVARGREEAKRRRHQAA